MSEHKVNRLAGSASPYLRSAAEQPVDWHEWGEDAFARARAEQKPILLDVGAVWCHWCHVIDRESYENSEIAKIINENYVAVKVDRDERPDVDSRYQAAVSAMTGQGGWPLTAFLTPEGIPFFGGTYFPPDDAMGRPGFRRILLAAAEAFRGRREEVEKSAKKLLEAIAQSESYQGARGAFDAGVVGGMVESITAMFDPRNGGFGQAPKFPHASAIDLLLEQAQATEGGKERGRLIEVVRKTLEKMAHGGVYDQLAGGFHRYSVDERWLVPHFEKMSYDNSELLRNYLHAYQITGEALFRETAEGIAGWVNEVLSDQAGGGFYASQDADQTLDDDGDYFTWTLAELREVLQGDDARAAELYYDVEARGEMHHNPEKNVLWVARSVEETARLMGVEESKARALIASAKEKMLVARRLRKPTPAVDTTIYTSWNAMFISAYLEAGAVLERKDCTEFALKSLERLIKEGWDEANGFRHRIGGPELAGSLDDQIFAGMALLDAYEATLEPRYFDLAERTLKLAIQNYGDPDGGGFFDRAREAGSLGGVEVKRKPFQDSPTPGTNSVAAVLCDRMYAYTGNRLYHEWAAKTLEAFAGIAPQFGLFAASYGFAASLHARHVMQVVVTGAAGDAEASALERAARGTYRQGKAVLRVTPEVMARGGRGLPPGLEGTIPHLDAGAAKALVCVEMTCYPPTSDPEELRARLAPNANAAGTKELRGSRAGG
jgi:uncharacterized protein